MDSYKPIIVLEILPLRFVGGHTNHLIKGNIQGEWDPKISISVVPVRYVPVE